MLINIFNQQKDLALSKARIRAAVSAIVAFEGHVYDEVSVHFVTKKVISQLHDQFFQDPSPTDCISFPMDSEDLGTVFVCPAVAIEYTTKHGGDPYTETLLYVIHGLLHLMGYDDLEPKTKRKMRQAEKRHLENLMQKGQVDRFD